MNGGTSIAFVVPQVFSGSGGLRTIVNAANELAHAGYTCTLIEHAFPLFINEDSTALLRDNYNLRNVGFANSYFYNDSPDLLVATSWNTAYYVREHSAKQKAYFIQDYEPWFSAMGDNYIAADASYSFGFAPITIGRWLAHKLSNRGLPAQYFDFTANSSQYRPTGFERTRAICAIFQPEKPRRCTQLLKAALTALHSHDESIDIYLYGSNTPSGLDFAIELGALSLAECNELYNLCSLGMCCSASNPSRVPFEMMAAGLPVVDLYLENNMYDFPDSAMLLASPTPESLAEAAISLLDDAQELERRSQAGIAFMGNRDSANETNAILAAFVRILEGNADDTVAPAERLYNKAAFTSRGLIPRISNIHGDYAHIELIAGNRFNVSVTGVACTSIYERIELHISKEQASRRVLKRTMTPQKNGELLASFDLSFFGGETAPYQIRVYMRRKLRATLLAQHTVWIIDSKYSYDDSQLASIGAQHMFTAKQNNISLMIEAEEATAAIDPAEHHPMTLPSKHLHRL